MELQSEEHLTFQRREWTVQKIGTFVLIAFIVAGCIGLLGAGPLATTTRTSADGLVEVTFDRVIRSNSDNRLIFTFAPQTVEDDTVTLELTGDWTSGMDLQVITPEPVEQKAIPDGISMTFLADSSTATEVTLPFVAREHFSHEGRIVVNGDPVSFNQFVLP